MGASSDRTDFGLMFDSLSLRVNRLALNLAADWSVLKARRITQFQIVKIALA